MRSLATCPPSSNDVALLHADVVLLVFDKPSGLLAVPGRGEAKRDCLAARAQQRWPDALVVHRLDMATSGLMLMARGLAAQRGLSRQFERREVGKRYVALVHGLPRDDAGCIELPLIADWPNRPLQKVDIAHGKPAITRWRVLARDDRTQTTRIELEPVTGRSHQLRVHLQAIGHPILGDALYAPHGARDAAPRLMLHASRVECRHPASGEPLCFESLPPF